MPTDTSERGLEVLIVRAMTGRTDILSPAHLATETSVPVAGGTGSLLQRRMGKAVDLLELSRAATASSPAARTRQHEQRLVIRTDDDIELLSPVHDADRAAALRVAFEVRVEFRSLDRRQSPHEPVWSTDSCALL